MADVPPIAAVAEDLSVADELRRQAETLQHDLSALTQQKVYVMLEDVTQGPLGLVEIYVSVDFDAPYHCSGARRRFHAIRERHSDVGRPLRRGPYGSVYVHPARALVLKVDRDMQEVDPDATGDDIGLVLRALMEHFVCGVVATRRLSGTLHGACGAEDPFPMVVQNTEVACRISVRNGTVRSVARFYEMERYDAHLSRYCLVRRPDEVVRHNEAFLSEVPRRILEHVARRVAYFDFKPEQFLVCYDDQGRLTKMSLTDVDMRFTRFTVEDASLRLASRVPFACRASEQIMRPLLLQQLAILSMSIRNWAPDVAERSFVDGIARLADLEGTPEWEQYVAWTGDIKRRSDSAHRFPLDGCALMLSYLHHYRNNSADHRHAYSTMERRLRGPRRSVEAAKSLASLRLPSDEAASA